MQYLNKLFSVSMPSVDQDKWDCIFSKDNPISHVSFQKIQNDTVKIQNDDLKNGK